MNRRQLLKTAALAPLLAAALRSDEGGHPEGKKTIKPRGLQKGDTVAVIAPGSGLGAGEFDRAVGHLEALGFRTRTGQFARGNQLLFSGGVTERLHDLHWAFSDPAVQAVWCLRGGNGCQGLLPGIDFDLIKKNPKVLIGYSDVTALHLAIYRETGLVTFHGPVASSEFTDYSKKYLFDVLMNPTASTRIECSEFNRSNPSELYKTRVITPGKARGRLIGGNLSLLTSLAGTPWALAGMKGALLFFEDIDESPSRIDRMLTQLQQSIDLRSLAGIAIGIMEGCVGTEKKPAPPLIDVLSANLASLGIPVIYGLSFGHIRDKCTLPIGLEAELDASSATLTLLEPAVI